MNPLIAPSHHDGLSASWLKDELYSIFGATIQGLWVGEDLVYDAAGDVTSWPGRIGPTLTNSTANRFKRAQVNGRLGTTSAALSAKSLYHPTSGKGLSFWLATNGFTATTTNQVGVSANSGNKPAIMTSPGNDLWTANGEVHCIDGLPTEKLPTDTSPITIEGYYPGGNLFDGIEVSGFAIGTPVWDYQSWQGSNVVLMQLSAIPTALQRIKGVIAIKRFRGIVPPSPAELLARDLGDILGAKLIGLWIGDDVVVDSANKVTSWPSRVGAFTLTNSNGNFQRITVSTRLGICTPDGSFHTMQIASGFTAQSFIAVAHSPALPSNAIYGLVHPNSDTGPEAALLLDIGASTWYPSGWTQYRDGVATTALAYGLHVYEADKAANVVAGVIVGGWSLYAAYPAPIMLAAALSAPPTAGERAAVTARLLDYYPTTAFDSFYKSHFDILGGKITGLWIGDQIVIDGSNLVQSWPGYGGTFIYKSATRFRGSSLNSKRALIAVPSAACMLTSTAGRGNAYYMVAEMPSTPVATYNIALDTAIGGGGDNPLTCYDTNRFFPGVASHYVNNILTEYFAGDRRSSLLSSQALNALNFAMGWNYTTIPNYAWAKPVALAAVLNALPSAAERNAIDALHKSYYDTGVPLNADEIKAASIPVAGAVVIAPLTAALRSYGSLYNVPFTVIGAPVATPNGAYFDGVDDALWLLDSSADFTVGARIKQLTFGTAGANGATLSVMSARPGNEGTWRGWAYEQYVANKYLLISGIARNPVGALDSDWHLVTLVRSSGIVTLYLDGVGVNLVGSGTLGGDGLVLGGSFLAGFFVNFMRCYIHNLFVYHTALSDPDRLSVEAWAAT